MKVFNNVIGKNLTIIDIREHREELIAWNPQYKKLLFQISSLAKTNIPSLGIENKVALSTYIYEGIVTDLLDIDDLINSTSAIAFFWDMEIYSNILLGFYTLREAAEQLIVDGRTTYDILMSFPILSEKQFYDDTTLAE